MTVLVMTDMTVVPVVAAMMTLFIFIILILEDVVITFDQVVVDVLGLLAVALLKLLLGPF